MNTHTAERRAATLTAGDRSLPLTAMQIEGTITGLLHHTKVRQTFLNDHEVPLEAVYTHPLPPRASVHGFRLVIGDRVIQGEVQERGQARQAYSQAVAAGHRAALMEEERSDIFTTTVGNIAPGETVEISFELSGPLEFLESTASLRFPLVVPEVYISGDALGGDDVGAGTAPDTDSVPDASRITPPRLPGDAPNPVDLRLGFAVDPAGLQIEEVASLCHFAKIDQGEDGFHQISLLPGVERMDRDFVITLRLKEKSLQTSLVHDPKTGTFALTVVPPLGAGAKSTPRDVVLVLDRSGSMGGWSMTAARRAAARIVESLTAEDRFNIIAFDDRCETFSKQLVAADALQQQLALEFLSKINARGGTEAGPAIARAVAMLSSHSSRDNTVLFLTDGDVGNDSELAVRSAKGIRVSTVGIGHNSRAGVLESMAKISGGLCTLIPEETTLEESLRNLHQRLGRPHWMGLSLRNHQDPDPAPRFWDVWEGVPTTFFGKAHELPETVEVEGWVTSSGKQAQKVQVLRREDQVIRRSWARARLLDLDDLWTIGKVQPSDLVRVSVEAQVLCRFTAFVAVDLSEKVENSEELRTVVQPVEPTLESHKLLQSKPMLGGARSQGAPKLMRKRMEFDAEAQAYPASRPCPAPMPNRISDDLFADGGAGDDLFGAPSAPAPSPIRVDLLPTEKKSFSPPSLSEVKDSARRGFNAARDMFKRPAPTPKKAKDAGNADFWRDLLKKLEELGKLKGDERKRALTALIAAVGAYHRALPGSEVNAAQLSRQVMSHLVDLERVYDKGEDGETEMDTVRAIVEAGVHLNG